MKRKILAGLLAACMVLAAAGCGSSSVSQAEYNAAVDEAGNYDTESGDIGYDSSESLEYSSDSDMDAADTAENSSGEDILSGSEQPAAESSEKIIYTADIDMETLEYSDTVKAIEDKIDSCGGIISFQQESDSNYNWYIAGSSKSGTRSMTVSVMIPAEKYKDFISGLAEAGQVTSRSMNAENITRSYNDTQVYIQSLEKENERLLAMMDQADEMEDMLAIERRISEVSTSLSQYRSQLSVMDSQIKYSTVNINITEVAEYTESNDSGLSFGSRMIRAFRNSFSTFAEFIRDFIIVIIYLLPYIILAAVAAAIIIICRRYYYKKRPEKAAAKAARKNRKKGFGKDAVSQEERRDNAEDRDPLNNTEDTMQ